MGGVASNGIPSRERPENTAEPQREGQTMEAPPRNPLIEAMAWLFKLLLKMLLVLIALIAAGAGAWYGYHYWTVERPMSMVRMDVAYSFSHPRILTDAEVGVGEPKDLLSDNPRDLEEYKKKKSAAIQAFLVEQEERIPSTPEGVEAGNRCSESHPIYTRITNESSRTVEEVRFSFRARVPQHSMGLIDWPASRRSTDRILQPGESVEFCWGLSKLNTSANPSTLEWSVSIEGVRLGQ